MTSEENPLIENNEKIQTFHTKHFEKFIALALVATLLIYTYDMGINNRIRFSIPNLINRSSSIHTQIFQYPRYSKQDLIAINSRKQCYQITESIANLQLLDDIDKVPPKPNKNIFFAITTCYNVSRVTLSARQVCAIESAAKMNPNRDVYVLFVSPAGFVANEPKTSVLDTLKLYPNVYLRNLNLVNVSKSTPAEEWIKEDRIFTSIDFVSHLSDFLRVLLVYKYGGIYLDVDFISIKSLDGLPPNFAAHTHPDKPSMTNAASGFSVNGIGHKIAEMALRENTEKYQPHSWDANGGAALRRATEFRCLNKKAAATLPATYCQSYEYVNSAIFFPLQTYLEAFETDPNKINNLMKNFKNETLAFHIWRTTSDKIKLDKSGKPNILMNFAKKVCPEAYGASGKYFN